MIRPLGLAAAFALIAFPALAEPRIERTVPVAPGVYELAFNPADGDVYVAAVGPRGADQAAIVRIDGATLAIEGRIELGAVPIYGLGLNARTRALFGTATREGFAALIDLDSGVVTHLGEGGAHIREVVVDAAANRAYVSVVGNIPNQPEIGPSAVWVVNGATRRIERVIELDAALLTGIAHDAGRGLIYGTAMGGDEIVVVDLATGQTVRRFPSGGQRPTNIVHDAQGDRLFVTNQGSGDLTVLNARTGDLIARIATGAGALSVAWNPAVGQIYVTNRQAGTVSVVDSRSYAVLAQLATGTFPQSVVVDPATHRVYVTNKARGLPRDAPAGTPAPVDPAGDTLTVIMP